MAPGTMTADNPEILSDVPEGGPAPAPPGEPRRLSAALASAESLCIRCGFCLPVCPTYRQTGVESASPRGRLDLMYAAARGELPLDDLAASLAGCLGCLACETSCPSGIDFGHMLEAGRIDLAARKGLSPGARMLLGRLLDAPRVLRLVVWAMFLYRATGARRLLRATRILSWLAPSLARIERAAPPVPRPFAWRRLALRRGWITPPGSGPAGRKPAALLTGCVMDAAFGAVHLATAQVLHRNGFATSLPPGQGCCGALQLHAGAEELARTLARRNIAAFAAAGEGPIVVNSAGCGAAMKAYGTLLADDPPWAGRAESFARRVVDISELLAGDDLAPPTVAVPLRVAYDDPCHLLHAQRIREPPRRMLRAVPGLELVELPGADTCCGSAGIYSLTQPTMARRLLSQKIAHLADSGAEAAASGNPGCLLQLALGAEEAGLALQIVHPVQLLARGYGNADEES